MGGAGGGVIIGGLGASVICAQRGTASTLGFGGFFLRKLNIPLLFLADRWLSSGHAYDMAQSQAQLHPSSRGASQDASWQAPRSVGKRKGLAQSCGSSSPKLCPNSKFGSSCVRPKQASKLACLSVPFPAVKGQLRAS